MTIRTNFLNFIALLLASFLLVQCGSENQSNNTSNTSSTPEEEITQNSTVNVEDNSSEVNNKADVQQQVVAVRPPFQGVDVPFKSYKIPASKAQTLRFETGTTIEIPANAFIDANGNPIKGEVEIQYREFHNAAQVMASGIIMQDEEGRHMQTAGMFEMKGSQNGQEIFVRDDKDIQVNMASYEKGNDYDFFRLDEKKCNWNKKGTAKPKINANKINGLAELKKVKIVPPVRPSKRGETDNFVFALDVNYNKFPELKVFNDIIWEYAGQKGDKNDPEKNPTAFQKNWADIGLNKAEKEGYFNLILQTGKDKLEIPVRPVLKGGDYDKAMAEFETQLGKYEELKAFNEDKRARFQRQADFVRSYKVAGFGIYNWDIWKEAGRINVPALLATKDMSNIAEELGILTDVYLICGGRKALVRYTEESLNRFSFDPTDDNIMMAVLPSNKVAVFTISDFKQMGGFSALKDKKQLHFNLETIAQTVSSVEDLHKIIKGASS
ncbi:MAG: hypothetical protein MK212_01165 [Saprospiraceae bacterium]|nr:hypothetical protein [Saprospiraceae bacterium]